MRILMIESGGWGGICHYSYNLCRALADQGIAVSLLTAHPYELADHRHNFDVETPFSADTPYREKLKCVARLCKVVHPQIIHVQSTFSARKDWMAVVLASIQNIPTVVTAHNVLPHEAAERDARGMHTAYRLIYRFARQTIVHSRDSRRILKALFAPSPGNIAIIPHGNYVFAGAAEKISRIEARRQLQLPTDGRLLLAFGTIRPYKGTGDLLAAFARVAPKKPDAHLVIAGKPIGIEAEHHRQQIQNLGIAQRVTYRPGYIPMEDVGLYFRATDIAVYPYHAIYQSGALQLAYACACPVIATDVGAFPETVDAGKNGLIVPPRSPEKLAQACLEMLNMPAGALTLMGRHSRHLADTRYAWSSIAKQTLAVYNRLSCRPLV